MQGLKYFGSMCHLFCGHELVVDASTINGKVSISE